MKLILYSSLRETRKKHCSEYMEALLTNQGKMSIEDIVKKTRSILGMRSSTARQYIEEIKVNKPFKYNKTHIWMVQKRI